MGLDTYLFNDFKLPVVEVCYWRKCWGIDKWLNSKIDKNKPIWENPEQEKDHYTPYYEFDCSILNPIVDKMKIYINKLTEKAKLYSVIESLEDLRLYICELEGCYYDDYAEFEKLLYTFNIDGLTIETFRDSNWSVVDTFIQTYKNFEEAIKYTKLYLLSSF